MFNADGTYTQTLSFDEVGTVTIPASCLMTGVSSCAMLETDDNVAGIDVQITNCSGSVSQGCACSLAETGTSTQTGTYKTAGTDVTTSPSGSTGTAAGYCVVGSTLQLSLSSSGGTFVILTR